jgi:long-subunit fatty acid transport protein
LSLSRSLKTPTQAGSTYLAPDRFPARALAFISHSQSFTRFGTYDAKPGKNLPWAGQPYETVTDTAKPDIGIGKFQAVPLLVVTTDFGAKLGKLRGAIGVFAPSGFPTRSMAADYVIDDPNTPPPPTRYDVMSQKAAVVLPSIALAYPISPTLRVGGRFSWGIASLDARQFVWGAQNYEEWTGSDTDFRVKANDNFVPAWGLGVQYAPTPAIELGAQYSSQTSISAVGDAYSKPSTMLDVGFPLTLGPPADSEARCAPGGTVQVQKGCVELALPMFATLGGRYKFVDSNNKFRGDVELNVKWENWSAERANNFRVVIDTVIADTLILKDSFLKHGFRDTYSVHLGGSYVIPVGHNEITVRGGVAYDTAAAKPGWERADFDGAARTVVAAGASYTLSRVRFDLGLGTVIEGTRTIGADCNPTNNSKGCSGNNTELPVGQRAGWDPVNPLVKESGQTENPVNHGVMKSGYLTMMLGVSTWF